MFKIILYVQNTVLEFMFPFTYEQQKQKIEIKKNYTNCRPNANVSCVSAQVRASP